MSVIGGSRNTYRHNAAPRIPGTRCVQPAANRCGGPQPRRRLPLQLLFRRERREEPARVAIHCGMVPRSDGTRQLNGHATNHRQPLHARQSLPLGSSDGRDAVTPVQAEFPEIRAARVPGERRRAAPVPLQNHELASPGGTTSGPRPLSTTGTRSDSKNATSGASGCWLTKRT